MFDPTKVAALKTLGFSDDDITSLQAQAEATEKSATDQGVAYKADEPAELPDVVINGVTYKAFKPIDEATAAPVEEDKAEPMGDMPMDEEPVDENALTLSAGDLAAISEAIQSAVAQVMGALDLEKKVAGHVQGLMAPFQQAQTTKDAQAAQTAEQLADLQQQVKELTGDQPAKPYRASESARSAIITDARLLEAAQKAAGAGAGPFDDIIQGLGLARPQ